MVKSKMNRFTAMLLSMIMILSSFSILLTTEANAADDPDKAHVDMYSTGIKWAKTVTFYEPYSARKWTYWQGQERHVLRVRETNQVAYCLQPGAYLYDWGISANPELSNKLNHAWDNLGKDKRNAIKLEMYFGYPNTNTTLSGTANEKELAIQLIIWEFISGYRDTDSYNRTDEKEYPFTINPDDTVVKAEMKNTGTGTIEITKTDISNGALIKSPNQRQPIVLIRHRKTVMMR